MCRHLIKAITQPLCIHQVAGWERDGTRRLDRDRATDKCGICVLTLNWIDRTKQPSFLVSIFFGANCMFEMSPLEQVSSRKLFTHLYSFAFQKITVKINLDIILSQNFNKFYTKQYKWNKNGLWQPLAYRKCKHVPLVSIIQIGQATIKCGK